jgi:chromosome segregation ATPase
MKKTSLLPILAGLGLTLCAVAPVLAQDGDSSNSGSGRPTVAAERQKLEAQHKEMETEREQKAKDVFSKIDDDRTKVLTACKAVETKVQDRVSNDDKLQAKHDERYTELVTKVTDLISRAKTAGYDTTSLESDLVTLQAKVAQFKDDKSAYMNALKKSQDYVCGKSEGEFKDAIVAARADLAVVGADAKDIHDYVQNTIKPAVKALKKAVVPTPSPTAAN